MDRSTSFAKLARHLTDLTVVRYDRRGYGHSVLGDGNAAPTIDGHVDDLLGLLGDLGDRPATIVGHSIGGVVALAAAQRSPHVARSVLAYESPMPWADWWPAGSAGGQAVEIGADDPVAAGDAAERFMRRIVGDSVWERLPRSTRDQRRAEGLALVAELRSVRPPASPAYDLDAITVPVIAAHGTTSAPHHIEAAERLAAALPGARLRVIEGAGHGAHSSHPAEFAALVREAVALASAGE
jgi:pimeloyl-ACP methyl ester carboxylesterase